MARRRAPRPARSRIACRRSSLASTSANPGPRRPPAYGLRVAHRPAARRRRTPRSARARGERLVQRPRGCGGGGHRHLGDASQTRYRRARRPPCQPLADRDSEVRRRRRRTLHAARALGPGSTVGVLLSQAGGDLEPGLTIGGSFTPTSRRLGMTIGLSAAAQRLQAVAQSGGGGARSIRGVLALGAQYRFDLPGRLLVDVHGEGLGALVRVEGASPAGTTASPPQTWSSRADFSGQVGLGTGVRAGREWGPAAACDRPRDSGLARTSTPPGRRQSGRLRGAAAHRGRGCGRGSLATFSLKGLRPRFH